MYKITKQFTFSASHVLDTLPPSHQCARLHGHNYIVELEMQSGSLDEHGFVVDYLALAAFKQHLDDHFDHRHLNDIMNVPTTAENIAYALYQWAIERWPQVTAVRVSETPKTWAEYRP